MDNMPFFIGYEQESLTIFFGLVFLGWLGFWAYRLIKNTYRSKKDIILFIVYLTLFIVLTVLNWNAFFSSWETIINSEHKPTH